ncbi:MAG TPA: hypothetical protein ENH29_08195 [Bacteroidetes bacterium]|nr:hypothetical protein [Bacteroidota bacterium]
MFTARKKIPALFLLGMLLLFSHCKNSVEPGKGDYFLYDVMKKIDDLNIRYGLALPAKMQKPSPVILALHYGGQVTGTYGLDFLKLLILPALKDLNAIIVAPNNPTGGNWYDDDSKKAVIGLLDSLKKEYNIDTTKIIITGYSLGAVGTWYYAGKYPNIFSVAVPVSGKPQDFMISMLTDVPIYVIHSRIDEVFPFEDVVKVVEQLEAKRYPVELRIVENVSHYNTEAFVRPLEGAITWIRNHWGK